MKENLILEMGDIDMKPGPRTKLDKRNKTMSKKFDNDDMPGNCDVYG